MYKLIIDENISEEELKIFKTYAKKKKIQFKNELNISDKYSGMPDITILNNFLNKNTIFFTKDMAFHNLIISKKLISYYISNKNVTREFLKGIKVKNFKETQNEDSDKLFNDDFLKQSEIQTVIIPKKPKQLKKLRTKRRRIRAYFGSYGNIRDIAATISWQNYNAQIVCGLKIQISSNTGVKNFTATENYFLENVDNDLKNYACFCHVLIVLLQLKLHSIDTMIFFDAPVFSQNPETKLPEKYTKFKNLLLTDFKNVNFQPVAKGYHLENLKKKISTVIKNQTNELKTGNLEHLINIWQ